MPSIFSRIIAREIPAYIVAEDEHHIAFLDVQPVAKGHTLVVPKAEVDYLFDLEPAAYAALWAFAQKVAKAVGAAIDCKRVGVAVIGLEVPHTHVHLLPLNSIDDATFTKPRLSFTPEEMQGLAAAIKVKM